MKGLMVLSLLTFASLLSQFGVPVGATNYDETAELHRSRARYRQFYEHNNIVVSMRNPLQVDEKIKDKLDSVGELDSIHPNPRRHTDENFKLEHGVVATKAAKKIPTDEDEIKNPQQASPKEQKQVKMKLLDDVVNATDRQKPVEDQLGRGILEEEEIEDFELRISKVHDSDPTIARTVEVLTRDLETLKKNIQPNLDEIERLEPATNNSTRESARNNSTEIQADKNSKMQHEVFKTNQKGKVVQVKKEPIREPIIEKLSKTNSTETVKSHQQREESLEKDVKVEQKGTRPQLQEERKEGEEKNKSFVFPEPYRLGPKIDDWDEQRGDWLEQNPHLQSPKGKPKVLIVTGSQPEPCSSRVGDYFHIQSLKLKMDYARTHNYEIYYSLAWLDPLFGGFWVKLPLIRKLMLTHPEIEWFFWIDSDAIFTDMLFEPPFHTYEGYNMVFWGWNDGVYKKKIWTAFNAGVFIIRNCQWSLDLIDKWSVMGPSGPVRNAYGKMLNAFLPGRGELYGGNFPADDQSALTYLFLTDEAVKAKVKLVEFTEYMLSGWWVDTVPLYKRAVKKYHPGFGDVRWPFITHFTGCRPCGKKGQVFEDYQKCMESFELAYNFADNQVLAFMGFEHVSTSAPNVTRIRNETGRALEFVGFNPWEERIAQVAASGINPWTDTTED